MIIVWNIRAGRHIKPLPPAPSPKGEGELDIRGFGNLGGLQAFPPFRVRSDEHAGLAQPLPPAPSPKGEGGLDLRGFGNLGDLQAFPPFPSGKGGQGG